MTQNHWMRCRLAAWFLLFSSILVAGCHRSPVLGAGRSTGFSNAQLVTQFYGAPASDRERAVLHILFLPAVEPPPGGGFGISSGHGGRAEELEFNYTYDGFDWTSKKVSIRSRPIRVHDLARLEADGQSFDLLKGSLFVAHVALDGRLQVTQLPVIAREHDPAPTAVLEAMKRHLPADKRLQALPVAPR